MTISPGIVYILINPSFPELVKIGFTRRTVKQRMKELDNTSIPFPYAYFHAVHVEHPEVVESRLHRLFYEWRVNKDREFFRIRYSTAVEGLELFSRVIAGEDDLPLPPPKEHNPEEDF